LPESFFDPATGIKPEFGQQYRDLVAFKATEDSRKLTLPQKLEDYTLSLPKDFKAPEGIEFVPDEKDPLLPQARAFAQKNGLTVDAFHELMGMHAAGQIGQQQNIAAAKAAEVTKLGVNGTARKTAVDTWLVAQVGEDFGKEMSKFTFTAKQVEGFEKLMAIGRQQGASGFSHQNREPPIEQGKVDQATYDKFSYTEKKDYAARFPQSNGDAR
jgi:hypothetical protein